MTTSLEGKKLEARTRPPGRAIYGISTSTDVAPLPIHQLYTGGSVKLMRAVPNLHQVVMIFRPPASTVFALAKAMREFRWKVKHAATA